MKTFQKKDEKEGYITSCKLRLNQNVELVVDFFDNNDDYDFVETKMTIEAKTTWVDLEQLSDGIARIVQLKKTIQDELLNNRPSVG